MTIPGGRCTNQVHRGFPPPSKYVIPEVSENGIFLSSELDDSLFDPMLLLAAQFSGKLFVCLEKQFFTNVHQIVYEDFMKKSKQWSNYVKLCGWNMFRPQDQLSGRAAACSIQDKYFVLADLGQQERCMFTLESIFRHLEELLRLENFFYDLIN